MFKPVNPNSRIPSYLQNGTKVNLVAQLAAVALFVAGLWIKDWYEGRKFEKQLALAPHVD